MCVPPDLRLLTALWLAQGQLRTSPGASNLFILSEGQSGKIRRTRFTPQLPTGWVGKGPAGNGCACLCVRCFSLSLLPSLLPSRQVIDMWRSLIPYGPERGGIHHSLPVPPPPPHLSSLSAPIQPQYHKLSVKLTGPSTISQGGCAAHRTLLYVISAWHRPLTQASHQGVSVCKCV